jgi:alpha-amylase/alpha-mannosidase (GH57 family)
MALVVHGHFYQPPRENPWTEEVPREPGATPFHDWNEKIALESYRPNAFARVLDERGRVVGIVNNYEHLSFDFGPTLTSWLEEHEPDAYRRVLEGDRVFGGGMAQSFFHVILPLATVRDARTQIRWGMVEFEHRFGRRAEGIWLPETAVNDDILRLLAEEGIAFTVLAPGQASPETPIDTRTPYRWVDPDDADGERGVDLVFYDGGLSHAVAFELSGLTSQALLDRVQAAAGEEGGLVTMAADGETFGHHHHWGDRLLAYALAVEAPKRGIEVTTVAAYLREHPPVERAEVVESAWSCAHGVGRWKEDCGCSTGGGPGWNQRWRAPLRAALDVVRDAVDEAFARRGAAVLRDPWAARDDYVRVLIGAVDRDAWLASWLLDGAQAAAVDDADAVEALTLLEAARHSMAMYTSCGWFFNDLAGLETVQCLRYAARALDCLAELGEAPPTDAFLDVLAGGSSNVAAEGDGRAIWERHVVPARVDAERVVAHLALVELLEGREPASRVTTYDVEVVDHGHRDGGALSICWGSVRLTHRRTRRRSAHTYAALHLGGLEVLGATRPADPARDELDVLALREAFLGDTPVTTLLRLVSDRFGPHEFGLASALPDAADQILEGAARTLSYRFARAYDQLFSDHRPTLTALAAAGYQLPPELRAPAEMALARRLEASVAAAAGSLDPEDYDDALAIVREARANGVTLQVPRVQAALDRSILLAVERAIVEPAALVDVQGLLLLSSALGMVPVVGRAQELVYDAVTTDGRDDLLALAAALGLVI